MKVQFWVLLLIIVSWVGCNSPEEVPNYLHIEPFTLTTTDEQGSNSHKITDAWVYVGSDLIGGFTLPITLPVLAKGEQEVTIFQGIRDNGIAATPELYPFYQAYQETRLFPENGSVDTIRPTTVYKSSSNFQFIESFEGNPIFSIDNDGDNMTSVATTTENALEGKSGYIYLTKEHPLIEVATGDTYSLPFSGQPVYLEMNYKNDAIIEVWIEGIDAVNNSSKERIIGLFPKEDWNKIYINLTEVLKESQLPKYRIILGARVDTTVEQSASIYLDNIKLLNQ